MDLNKPPGPGDGHSSAAVSLTLVVLVLVGCQGAPVPGGAPDPLEATAVPSGVFPPAPLTTAAPTNRVGLPWTLRGMSPDGRRLYLSYGVGDGCGDYVGQVFVEETDRYVAIASLPVAGASASRSGNACAAVLKTQDGYVDLTRPLWERPLMHFPD